MGSSRSSGFHAPGLTCPSCNSFIHRQRRNRTSSMFGLIRRELGGSVRTAQRIGIPVPAIPGGERPAPRLVSQCAADFRGNAGPSAVPERLTHGFVVDGQGKKMSKVPWKRHSAQEIINKYGADILRLWVSAEDYATTSGSPPKYWNGSLKRIGVSATRAGSFSAILPVFDPKEHSIEPAQMRQLDRFALDKLNRIIQGQDRVRGFRISCGISHALQLLHSGFVFSVHWIS